MRPLAAEATSGDYPIRCMETGHWLTFAHLASLKDNAHTGAFGHLRNIETRVIANSRFQAGRSWNVRDPTSSFSCAGFLAGYRVNR